MNRIKRVLLIITILVVVVMVLPGCSETLGFTSVTSEDTAGEPPIKLELTVTRLGNVGETTGLHLAVSSMYESFNITPWLEFICKKTSENYLSYTKWEPVDAKQMQMETKSVPSGELRAGTRLKFDYEIVFPYEGIWEVKSYIGEPGNITASSRTLHLNVQKDRAGDLVFDKQEWMEDYAPPNGASLFGVPFDTVLDMNKPPKLDEEVELTWELSVTEDFEEVELWVEFWRMDDVRHITYDSRSLITEGDLTWKGPMEAGTTVSLSAPIAFPEEGDWEIILWFRRPEKTRSTSEIYLYVSENIGRWGWVEPHTIRRTYTK
ncbi:MAG: hypothetical protein JW712_07790 [Dehalococcoidales bacterium]|nr:hypothetical protein [Dehalococcoidales bacterium]